MPDLRTACSARLVQRDELDAATGCLSRAKATAAKMIEDAQKDIQHQYATLAEATERHQGNLQAIETKAIEEAKNRASVAARASEACLVLEHATRFQSELDLAAPMLVQLVQTCLLRIIGKLDPGEVLAATVAEAIIEFQSKAALSLRISPDDQEEVRAVLAAHPETCSAVTAVITDLTLPTGSFQIEGSGGFADLTIRSQISALCSEIMQIATTHQETAT